MTRDNDNSDSNDIDTRKIVMLIFRDERGRLHAVPAGGGNRRSVRERRGDHRGRPETAGRRARGQLATGHMAPKATPTKKKASPLVAAISAALLKSAKQSKGTTVASRGRKPQTRRDKRG